MVGDIIADSRATSPGTRMPEDTLSLIRELARVMPDQQIARLLNRKPTGRGNGWTKARVGSLRSHHGIAVYRQSEWPSGAR